MERTASSTIQSQMNEIVNGLCTHLTIASALPIHHTEKNYDRNNVINYGCEWTLTRGFLVQGGVH